MNTRASLLQRVVLAASATAAMSAAIFAIHRASATRRAAAASYEVAVVMAGPPIAAEAGAFRMHPGMEAVPPESRRRPNANPRTLARYRALRSYPGAPPRVPHGLTREEFRTNRCTTCHERGGFSQRFGAYAPVTPHPEFAACLQCHATTNAMAGIPLPQSGPNDACRQCHGRVPARFQETGLDWRTAPWPTLANRAAGAVPPMPHDLQLRGNCLACHMGPGAVAEIRTTHPERADCRQCHVAGEDDARFARPPASRDLTRGVP
jgi:cytochrome c-type protein NapB